MSETNSTDPIGSNEVRAESRRLHGRLAKACQHANKSSWRKAGRRFYVHQRAHGLPIKDWMHKAFGNGEDSDE